MANPSCIKVAPFIIDIKSTLSVVKSGYITMQGVLACWSWHHAGIFLKSFFCCAMGRFQLVTRGLG